jgi:hypothetical protein
MKLYTDREDEEVEVSSIDLHNMVNFVRQEQ